MKPSIVIVGLGNPGASYAQTRHNVGFRAVERLQKEFGEGEWVHARKFLSVTCESRFVTAPVLLVEPQTYMNRSGEAVRKVVDFYKLDPAKQLLVLCDDIDLPLGEVRYREKGGAGTHNGMQSIVDVLGENFPRLRIGIGAQPPDEDLAAWVLSVPSKEEAKQIDEAVKMLPERVREVVLNENQ